MLLKENSKFALLFVVFTCTQIMCAMCAINERDYITEQELEFAVLHSKSNFSVPNLYVLANVFLPLQKVEPICVPVQYNILCENDPVCTSSVCINCTDSVYISNFLWAAFNVRSTIGTVLLSYALDGIDLVGFSSWEDSCSLVDPLLLYLKLNLSDNSEISVVSSLEKITSRLKEFAVNQGKEKVGDRSNEGFAIQWNTEDQDQVFYLPNIILTAEFVFLNVFICFLSVSMITYTYKNLFQNVKHKKNPGYPIFWGLVSFTFLWNVGPSWLVLVRNSTRITYSLVCMIPLQFFIALFLKKESRFPIPGMRPNAHHHSGYHFIWEQGVIKCWRCLVSHVVQVLAFWSILITFTFVVYYLAAITVTFYLYPADTLVKAVFAKGIAVSTILVFSLVFSLSKFKFKCTYNAFKHDCVTAFSVVTVISFLPVLGYIAFLIGGIIFAERSDANTVKSILTLLPSLFLIFVAWASRGHLFPEGLHTTDATDEIISDLERGATENHHTKQQSTSEKTQVPLSPTPSNHSLNEKKVTQEDRKSPIKREYTPLLGVTTQ